MASTDFTTFIIINYRRLIRKCLKSHPLSNYCQSFGIQPCSNQQHGLGSQLAATTSSSLINTSKISKIIFLLTKTLGTGYSLCYGYRYCIKIKNFTLATRNLCKYIWEIVAYMVLTGKKCLRSDLWLKISKQAKKTGNMISTT